MADYYSLVTEQGRNKISLALADEGPKVQFAEMVIGDGGGNPVVPDDTRQLLVNEVYTTTINRVYVSQEDPNSFVIEGIIPATEGGWTVREVGIIDPFGTLVVHANFPETYKSTPAEGSSQDLTIRIYVRVSDASAVTIVVDPTTETASRSWVESNFFGPKGGTTGQLLRKLSNDDFDVEWFSLDISGLQIQFDTIEEVQTLAQGQTVVDWNEIVTNNAGYYIEGGRLIPGDDYDVTGPSQITLTREWAVGTKIHGVQNDQAAGIQPASTVTKGLAELATDQETLDREKDDVVITPANLDALIQSLETRFLPTGQVSHFALTTAPDGWIPLQGGTIGNADSGATVRAHEDTWPLFEKWWAAFNGQTWGGFFSSAGTLTNAKLKVYDSDGNVVERGASAQEDWDADRRLEVFDDRGLHYRAVSPVKVWETPTGAIPEHDVDRDRAFGSYQEDALQDHQHRASSHGGWLRGTNGPYAYTLDGGNDARTYKTHFTGRITTANQGDSVPSNVADETRPHNRAYLTCVKL